MHDHIEKQSFRLANEVIAVKHIIPHAWHVADSPLFLSTGRSRGCQARAAISYIIAIL